MVFSICQVARVANKLACVQTSPISLVARAEKVPFPRATKQIGNVCSKAITNYYAKLGDSAYVRKVPERNEGVGCHAPPVPPPRHARLWETDQWYEDWEFLVNLG